MRSGVEPCPTVYFEDFGWAVFFLAPGVRAAAHAGGEPPVRAGGWRFSLVFACYLRFNFLYTGSHRRIPVLSGLASGY
jgi:hypothetical protein